MLKLAEHFTHKLIGIGFNKNRIVLRSTPFFTQNRFHSDNNDPDDSDKPNANDDKRRKLVETETEYAYAMGRYCPDPATIQCDDWKHLTTLPTKSARRKYLRYLAKRNEAKEQKRIEKEQRKAETVQQKQKEDEAGTTAQTKLLSRILPSTITKWKNQRLERARVSGQKLVFDCAYDELMSHKDKKQTARQLSQVFTTNRDDKVPFDMHLCNVNVNGQLFEFLRKSSPHLRDNKMFMAVHEQCFTELFPVENLIYLSPDSNNELDAYNADDIFVVGAFMDSGPNRKVSVAKAKQMGLQHARLPFDRHVCSRGINLSSCLDLVTMTNVLLDWKRTRNWFESFKTIREKADALREAANRRDNQ